MKSNKKAGQRSAGRLRDQAAKAAGSASGAPRLPDLLCEMPRVDPNWLDVEPPLPIYVVDPYLQTQETAVVTGRGGTGKAFFLMHMFFAIGTGIPFFEFRVPQKRRCAYAMLERSERSLHRRYGKIFQAIRDDLPAARREQFRKDARANCRPLALAGKEIRLIEFHSGEWHIVEETVARLIRAIVEHGIEVLFLDPVSRLHGGDESNAVFSVLTRVVERINLEARCAVVLVHHVGKNGRANDPQYSARGGSAIVDNTSEVLALAVVDPKELGALDLSNVPADERGADIVLVQHARCSDGPRAPDLYLLRNPETGVLLNRKIRPKSADARAEQQVPAVRDWAGERTFTRREFIQARTTWGLGMSKRGAEDMFDTLVRGDHFRSTGEKRKRGELFSMWPSAPGHCGPHGPLTEQLGGPLKKSMRSK